MCGIAGFSRQRHGEPELRGMLERLGHRGPDGSGVYVDDAVAIGNVLLAIVDIGHGQQPVVRNWRGETYVIAYNGEIYNQEVLRTRLEDEGFVFSTHCDTEVALAGFAAWGVGAFGRFDGQWALAVWEAKRRRLTLSRDPFGIKPLFFRACEGGISFASEPKAILSLPDVPCRPNLEAVREYFLHGFAFASGYSLSHRSFFEGVDSLPPGHHLEWSPGDDPVVRRYFNLPFDRAQLAHMDRAASQLEAVVRASVEASMMGEAPIGVALSGGLDSSIITTVAAEVAARRGQPPLLASCIRYGAQATNEDADHAALLAEWLGSERPVHLVFSHMDLETYLDDVDLMIRHFDEPHWEVKQLAMFNNYRVLRAHGAKVVLTGEGADELFFGYYHRFPGFKSPVIGSAGDLRRAWSARVPAAARLLAGPAQPALLNLLDEAVERFYEPAERGGADPARAMQCWYLSTFLHWLLIDNDRCSMAFSLEGRFPFLNQAVLELAFQLSPSLQLGADHGGEKLVLRKAFREALPEQIWRHRKKAPLPSPIRLSFHRAVRDALDLAIRDAPSGIWDVVDRGGASSLLAAYSDRIAEIEAAGRAVAGGEDLTRYLGLDEQWSVRTPHAFGLLTLFTWWRQHFS